MGYPKHLEKAVKVGDKVFESQKAAAEWLGVTDGTIHKAIKHGYCCKGHKVTKA